MLLFPWLRAEPFMTSEIPVFFPWPVAREEEETDGKSAMENAH